MWNYKKNRYDHKSLKRKGKTIYHSKIYSNPYFSLNKRKKFKLNLFNFTFKIKLFLLLVVLAILGCAWLVFYSKFFDIKYIEASGGQRVDYREVQTVAWEQVNHNFLIFIKQKNIFLFNVKNLSDALNRKFGFNELTIKRKLPDTLVIIYKEKNYALIWQEDENYFFIDTAGIVLTSITAVEAGQKLYPIVVNASDTKISDSQVGCDKSYIDYILALAKIFKEQSGDIKIKNYLLDNEAFTIKVIQEKGPTILVSTKESIDRQVQKLLILKNEKLKNDFSKKEYIDIRYGDRVYYR